MASTILAGSRTAPRDSSVRVKGKKAPSAANTVRLERGGIVYNMDTSPAAWHRYRLTRPEDEQFEEERREQYVKKLLSRSGNFSRRQVQSGKFGQSHNSPLKQSKSVPSTPRVREPPNVTRTQDTYNHSNFYNNNNTYNNHDEDPEHEEEAGNFSDLLAKFERLRERQQNTIELVKQLEGSGQNHRRSNDRKIETNTNSDSVWARRPATSPTRKQDKFTASAHTHGVAKDKNIRSYDDIGNTSHSVNYYAGEESVPPAPGVRRSSAGERRGSATVPAPFRSMELHELAWRAKRDKEALEAASAANQIEEDKRNARLRLIKSVQHGKPFEGVIARSQEMLNRRRSSVQAADIAKVQEEMEKSSGFKAKPIHANGGEDWVAMRERQAVQRAQRVELRKAELLKMSQLPQRMALHAEKEKNATKSTSTLPAGGTPTSSTIVKPRPEPAQVRESLDRQHRKWEAILAAKKVTHNKVRPPTLPIEERGKEYALKAEERRKAKELAEKVEKESLQAQEAEKRKKAMSVSVPVVPRTTFSHMLKARETQDKLDKEAKEAERTQARDAMRKERQTTISKQLAAAVRENQSNTGDKIGTSAGDAAKRAAEAARKFQRDLKDNAKRLAESVQNRPNLVERHDVAIRKEVARKETLSAIAQSVYGGGTGWKTAALKDGLFDDEELAILEGVQ